MKKGRQSAVKSASKLAVKLTSFLLAVGMMFTSFPASAGGFQLFKHEDTQTESADRPYFLNGSSMSGIMIETRNNLDYPSQNSGYWTLPAEARKVTSTASKLGADTLFYQATPNMQAMYHSHLLPKSPYFCKEQGMTPKDPLKALIKEADAEAISVCAVISPFEIASEVSIKDSITMRDKHQSWTIKKDHAVYLNPKLPAVRKFIGKVARELTLNYRIRGVVLDFSDSIKNNIATFQDIYEILRCVDDQVHSQSDLTKVGVILPGYLIDPKTPETVDFLHSIAESGFVDFIMPEVFSQVNDTNEYGQVMLRWREILENSPRVQLFGYQNASRILAPLCGKRFYDDPKEILFQQFSDQYNGISGSLINSLYDIRISPSLSNSLAFPAISDPWYYDPALYMPNELIIGSPAQESFITDQPTCKMTGMCDPSMPLYINGVKYKGKYGKISSTGHFVIELPLNFGINHFVFRQASQSVLRQVVRTKKGGSAYQQIDCIIPESAYPSNTDALYEDHPLQLSCIAPSGAEITATVGPNCVRCPLTQEDSSIPEGMPAKYSASIEHSQQEYAHYRVSELGNISYTMTYQDRVTLQKSLGELYFVGNEESLAVRISDPMAFVYTDITEQETMHTLPALTKDYVTDISDDHFFLQSGGCIRKSAAEVLTSKTDMYTFFKKIPNVVIQNTAHGEYITIVGGSTLPCRVNYDPAERIVTIDLDHIREIPKKLNYLTSEMFETIQVKHKEDSDSAQLVLKMREDVPFYGYQVSFNENNIIIYFRSRFQTQKDPETHKVPYREPLSGLNIVIDAAHGGSDLGCPSLLGPYGPNAESLNLALAQALADDLHAQGANVFLTRSNHSAMAGIDRVMYSQYRDADFFISLDHCSGSGKMIQVNCNNHASLKAAQEMQDELSEYLGFPAPEQSHLCKSYPGGVTMASAFSICIGDLMDPEDYLNLSDPVNIYRTASKISEEFSNSIQNMLS